MDCETKHTVRYEGVSSQGHVFIGVDGNAGAIDCGPLTPEIIKLARQMAAAPELLEACEAARRELAKLPLHHLTGLSVIDSQMERAIRKAGQH